MVSPLAPVVNSLSLFHEPVREWFQRSFEAPTRPQRLGWPAIARGESTLILAPTGSGKTLTAFMWCLNRLMFEDTPETAKRCRVLYVSPLKALAVDVERNLRAPLAGIANVASSQGTPFHTPAIGLRTGETQAGNVSHRSMEFMAATSHLSRSHGLFVPATHISRAMVDRRHLRPRHCTSTTPSISVHRSAS